MGCVFPGIMIPGDTWCFTDEDRARLEPLLNRLLDKADAGIPYICELARTTEGRIRILQGYCEALAERLTEEILEQVDRGEWSARGINKREDISITVTVDAAGSVLNDTNLIHLSMQPTESLS